MNKSTYSIVLSVFLLPWVCSWAQPQADTLRYETIADLPTYYLQMRKLLDYPQSWQHSKKQRFHRWRKKARRTLLKHLDPAPPRTNFHPQVIATEQREGYKVHRIEFNISAWSRIPAYLLIPEGEGPFPAIIALHDHGGHFSIGKEKMVRPFRVSQQTEKDALAWTEKCYDGNFVGDELARHGYAVLAIDALFWGERGRKEGIRYDSQQALAANFMQLGACWSAFITHDDIACADFLATLPEIDASHIGSFGFSMGAYRSWMLAAATDRIKAAASLCWMCTTDALMTPTNNQNKGGSAYAMLIPGLRQQLDYPHVASIACPKPMLFYNGTHDKLFPIAGVTEAYRQMQEVWKNQHATSKLTTQLWEEKHVCSRQMLKEVILWFDQWLKP